MEEHVLIPEGHSNVSVHKDGQEIHVWLVGIIMNMVYNLFPLTKIYSTPGR